MDALNDGERQDQEPSVPTKPEQPEVAAKQEDEIKVASEKAGSEIDNEEEGGEWVTADNIHKHVTGGQTGGQDLLQSRDMKLFQDRPNEDKAKEATQVKNHNEPTLDYVKFITSDFAMQNVII